MSMETEGLAFGSNSLGVGRNQALDAGPGSKHDFAARLEVAGGDFGAA